MKKSILILFVAILSATTFAQTAKHINLKNNVALQGYDPVAYFESAKAIEGNKEIKSEYNGAIYHFSSESNKTLFLKNPSKYEPQFGGFCAYGMSQGYKAPIQPEAFTIVDGKLYLNYNLKVKEMWSKEQTARIEKAILNWENIQKK
jgi:YHS domain-containing protein